MKQDKDTVRNRAIRLLEEMQADHTALRDDIKLRLAELEQHHTNHGETFSVHHDLLTAHGRNLDELKEELMHMRRAQDDHNGLLRDHMQKVEASAAEQQSAGRTSGLFRKHAHPSNREDHLMADTIEDTNDERHLQDWRRLSWSPIFLGAVAALAINVMLHVLGLGVTASSVDANNGTASDAAATVGGVAGIWFLVSTAISLFIGGFLASTLAHTFTSKRATIYGLGVWALTTLVTMSVLVPALVKGVGATASAAGTVADRAGGALGSLGGAAVQAGSNAPAGFLDRLQKTVIGTTKEPVDPAVTQEVSTLIGQRITQGEWTAQQRDQLNNLVARAAGIPVDDARRRVDEAQNNINATLEQAKERARQAAEATRKTIAMGSYYTFGALLIGLLAALFGARYGEMDENELPAFARIRFAPPRMREI